MKKQKTNRKIKVESIAVYAIADESPDTSYLGDYTHKADDWNIDRRKNEYVAKLRQRERIIEILTEWIENDCENPRINPEAITRYKKRIEKIEQSFPFNSFIERNSYEYFKPYAGGETPGTADYRKYGMQDYERMEALNNGHWYYLGILAKAEVLIPCNDPTSNQIQTIRSGGLWGIESDSGEDYLQGEAKNQLDDLAQQLRAIGIGARAISYAIKNWDSEIIYK